MATVALVALAGCSSSIFNKNSLTSSNVRTIEGQYKSPKSVAVQNDIKGILAAGGLNTHNPSAPTKTTKVKEVVNSRAPSRAVAQLVARLENGSIPSVSAPTGGSRPQKRETITSQPTTLLASAQKKPDTKVSTQQPTTLMASLQKRRENAVPARKIEASPGVVKRNKVQPSVPVRPASDPVMIALNAVAPVPTARPDVDVRDIDHGVTQVAVASAPNVAPAVETLRAPVNEISLEYPTIGAIAYADTASDPLQNVRANRTKTTPKRNRVAVGSAPTVVKQKVKEEPVIQQASLDIKRPPRRF